jgi:hypothetical protein
MRRVSRSAGSWRVVAVGCCAVTFALVTACSSGTAADGSGKPQTAQQALTLAADQTQQVSSLAGDISIQVGSLGTASGTLQMQVRPTVLLEMNLGASDSSQSGSLSEILSSNALYLQIPGLSALTGGRPWAEVPFSDLSGSLGSAVSQSVRDAESSNPLSQAQILATSKLVHKVGTQVVNGISTTQYAGTVSASAALSALPASASKALSPYLKLITGDISFNVWIDNTHVVRKLTENETVDGQGIVVTITVSSVNQPVTVAIPAASQVFVLSVSDLSGL